MNENAFGLPKDIIDALEAKLASFTFGSIVERLDSVFSKGWSYHFEGPEVVQVPKRIARYPQAKNPRSFRYVDAPHWHCKCAVEIYIPNQWMDHGGAIVREYSVCVPVDEGSFEFARDLAFVYTAHYGLGVGRRSTELFQPEGHVEIVIGEPADAIENHLKELASIKTLLKITGNVGLDGYVREWNPELANYMDINKTNIREFITFLRTKVTNDSDEPDRS
jgi:hypothetical protein